MEEPLVISWIQLVSPHSTDFVGGWYYTILFLGSSCYRGVFLCMTLDWQMRLPRAVERVAARKTS